MSKLKIAVIVGSLSQQSINRKLGEGLAKLMQDQADFEFIDISRLPVYNRDFDNTPDFKPFEDLKPQIRGCNGVLFITPEYNRSIPASLKNVLDGLSRPYGQTVWAGIPAAIIGSSPGGAASAMAQQHLRNVLVSLDMPTMAQPEGFVRWSDTLLDADGHIGAASHGFLTKYMSKFLDWVQLHPKK